jgi:hypothetical protein
MLSSDSVKHGALQVAWFFCGQDSIILSIGYEMVGQMIVLSCLQINSLEVTLHCQLCLLMCFSLQTGLNSKKNSPLNNEPYLVQTVRSNGSLIPGFLISLWTLISHIKPSTKCLYLYFCYKSRAGAWVPSLYSAMSTECLPTTLLISLGTSHQTLQRNIQLHSDCN